MFPKPQRLRDPDFVAWSKASGCAMRHLGGCCKGLDFHHVATRGGAGSNPVYGGSDYAGLAVCRVHHNLLHSVPLTVQVGFSVWEHLFRRLHMWMTEGT
jgi:hypothetical protein